MIKYSKLDKTKKYNFVYKTIQDDGHYYYGRHSTNKLNDGYIGSGVKLKTAIQKFGKKSFKCIILKYFETYDLAYNYEKSIITEDILNDIMCYNKNPGGAGGLQWDKNHVDYEKIKEKCRIAGSSGYKYVSVDGRKRSNSSFTGKTHSIETKKILREKNLGKNNPQFGISGKLNCRAKNYIFYIDDGSCIEYFGTLCEYARINNHVVSGLHMVLTGKRNRHHNINKIIIKEIKYD